MLNAQRSRSVSGENRFRNNNESAVIRSKADQKKPLSHALFLSFANWTIRTHTRLTVLSNFIYMTCRTVGIYVFRLIFYLSSFGSFTAPSIYFRLLLLLGTMRVQCTVYWDYYGSFHTLWLYIHILYFDYNCWFIGRSDDKLITLLVCTVAGVSSVHMYARYTSLRCYIIYIEIFNIYYFAFCYLALQFLL